MNDFIRTLHTDQTTFFSLIPRDVVYLVAKRVPRAVFENEKKKLLGGANEKKNVPKAADAAKPASSVND